MPKYKPITRCRTCGHIGYQRGPCALCRVFGEYGPTDVIEVYEHGTHARTLKELYRWKKEALTLREVYRAAMKEADELRKIVHRSELVALKMEEWERSIASHRKWLTRPERMKSKWTR